MPADDRIHNAWDDLTDDVAGVAGELTSTLGVKFAGDVEEVGDGDTVEIEVNRTYGVTEAEVACSLFLATLVLRSAERDERVAGAALGTGTIGRLFQKLVGRLKRRATQTQQLALKAHQVAVEQAQLLEQQAELAAAEAHKMAVQAAQAAKEEAIKAAKEAQELANSPSTHGQDDGATTPRRLMEKISPRSPIDIDWSEIELPDVDLPEFLRVEEDWAIELDVKPVDAPGLTDKRSMGMGFFGKSKKLRTGSIPLIDIASVETTEEVRGPLTLGFPTLAVYLRSDGIGRVESVDGCLAALLLHFRSAYIEVVMSNGAKIGGRS
jgi:hypothetical protein